MNTKRFSITDVLIFMTIFVLLDIFVGPKVMDLIQPKVVDECGKMILRESDIADIRIENP